MPTPITNKHQHIKNPLTLIAVFAGLAEVASISVLPILDGSVQCIFVWYVMFFPILLVIAFFLTLNFNHEKLYAPSDFKSDEAFLSVSRDTFTPIKAEAEIIRNFWKPGGVVNSENELKILKWLSDNDLNTAITIFVNSKQYENDRKNMVNELKLL